MRVSNVVVLPGRTAGSAPDAPGAGRAREEMSVAAAGTALLDLSSSLMGLMPLLDRMRRLLLDEMRRTIERENAPQPAAPRAGRRIDG